MITIATKVYAEEDITLQDGTDVTLRPLVIGKLRRFMTRWEDAETDGEDQFKSMDLFVDVCGISLEDDFKAKFDRLKGSKDDLSEDAPKDAVAPILSNEYREYLEDTLDMDSIYKIIEVCGGIKLNDPKLMERAMASLTEDGTI